MKNNSGKSASLIMGILATMILIALYFSLSFRQVAVDKEELINEGLLDSNSQNVYIDALNQARKIVYRPVRPIDETDHQRGNLNAPAQLIVYSDYTSEFCSIYYDTVKFAKAEFGDNLNISLRHFSLDETDQISEAALASECASEQGKFFEMSEILFVDLNSGQMLPGEYLQDARALDLETGEFQTCMEVNKYRDKIFSQISEAKNFGVTGLPTSFLNGEMISGALPFEDYTDINGERREGLKTKISKILGY